MDVIFIRDLRIETRIGVYAWEQHLAQPLVLDIEFELPSSQPFGSDQLADAVDYSAVVKRVQALATDHSHRLLERFTEAVADVVLREFGAPWVRVSVAKLAPVPGAARIGVRIERGSRTS
ncbi:MAG: dihydroneopterin aldolase [Betaproteobacteria bacterium]